MCVRPPAHPQSQNELLDAVTLSLTASPFPSPLLHHARMTQDEIRSMSNACIIQLFLPLSSLFFSHSLSSQFSLFEVEETSLSWPWRSAVHTLPAFQIAKKQTNLRTNAARHVETPFLFVDTVQHSKCPFLIFRPCIWAKIHSPLY